MDAHPTFRRPFFTDEYELTIDGKNRVLVPADIRKAIDPAVHGVKLFVTVGSNRAIWIYPDEYFQKLAANTPADMAPDDELLDYLQLTFSMSTPLEWDTQGRVVLPEKLLRRTDIDREVSLVGVYDHLEIWNRQSWERRRDELDKRRSEILKAIKPRLTPPSQPTPPA